MRDDATLRNVLLAAGRDVPVDAIARWTSSERDDAQRWVNAALNPGPFAKPDEPECLKRDATPALLDDHIAAKDEGWETQPPPKVDDVDAERVHVAIEGAVA